MVQILPRWYWHFAEPGLINCPVSHSHRWIRSIQISTQALAFLNKNNIVCSPNGVHTWRIKTCNNIYFYFVPPVWRAFGSNNSASFLSQRCRPPQNIIRCTNCDTELILVFYILQAQTVNGALHALETFSQLCCFDFILSVTGLHSAPWISLTCPDFLIEGFLLILQGIIFLSQ